MLVNHRSWFCKLAKSWCVNWLNVRIFSTVSMERCIIRVHGLMGADVLTSQVTAAVGSLRPSLLPATTCRGVSRIQTNARLVRFVTLAHASSSHGTEKSATDLSEVQVESDIGQSYCFQRALLTATAGLTPFLLSVQVLNLQEFLVVIGHNTGCWTRCRIFKVQWFRPVWNVWIYLY